jgi:polysaccharide biosynthesis protein PslF
MRVLFLTGEYPTMQGGVGDYTRELARALGVLGADVHVLTSADAGDDTRRGAPTRYEPAVHPILRHTGWGLWQQAAHLAAEMRADVVHIQYQAAAYAMHPAVNYLPHRLHMSSHAPCVAVTFHDLKVPYLFPKAGPVRWQVIMALAQGSDAVVLTNPVDWAILTGSGRAGAALTPRLHPIPIGSNIERRPPADFDRGRQRARWGVAPDDWLLAYFGFLNVNKGGETLVRCLGELVRAGHPARLLMVGGKTGSSDPTNLAYLARVEGLIAELGLTGRVQWTGFVPPEEVSANLLAADCAVLPYREGASLRHGSLMAALAHGLPIVTTAAPGVMTATGLFPSLMEGESALFVPPDDPATAALAVTRLMGDPALCARLSAGVTALSHRFGWDAIAADHMEMYRHLLRS